MEQEKEKYRHVEVVQHDSKWPQQFQEAVQALLPFLKDDLISYHHIGSTSIPELPAKPVVDILIIVKDLHKIERFETTFQKLGYLSRGESGIPGRRYFKTENNALHLHFYQEGHEEIQKLLNFRDFLIAHPEVAKEYGLLKKELAKGYPQDRQSYREGKSRFIEEINEKAKKWAEEGPRAHTTFPLPIVRRDICYLKNVIKNPNILIGDYTYYHDKDGAERFEKENVIYHEPILRDKLIIGKFCQIAMGTQFMMNASLHYTQGFSTYPFGVFNKNWAEKLSYRFPNKGDTIIGNDVWFGYQSLVMPGIKIGDGAIIATRALVTKDIPPYTIVGGNPAREIRKRFDDHTVQELLRIKWWDWPIETIINHLPEIVGADLEKLLNIKVVGTCRDKS